MWASLPREEVGALTSVLEVRVRPGQTAAHLLLDLDECFVDGSIAAVLLSCQLGLQAALLSHVVCDHAQGLFDATV